MKAKLAFALGVLLLALAAGMYLSGYLTLLLLKMPEVPLTFGTYWRYVKAIDLPQVAPYVARIKIAGAIGFGLPLLAWLFLAFAMRGAAATRHPRRCALREQGRSGRHRHAQTRRQRDCGRQDGQRSDPPGRPGMCCCPRRRVRARAWAR